MRKPKINVDLLVELYPNHSKYDIAEKVGCSVPSVFYWAKRLGLKKSPEYLKKVYRERKLGKPLTQEVKDTISIKLKAKPRRRRMDSLATRFADPRYSEWREAVFKRDGYKCTDCGAHAQEPKKHASQRRTYGLDAHHIKSYHYYPKLRYELDNGLSLCRACHMKLHKRKWV